MSDTIPMGEPAPSGDPGTGLSDSSRSPVDKTTKYDAADGSRDCIHCGQRFSGLLHTPCPADDKTIQYASASRKPGFSDLPPEAAEAAVDPARVLNQYLLVRQIGKGGMGVVWKAWDRTLTRWVAIKFLTADESDAVARFRREAQISARLRHPNIAAIFEVGTASSRHLGQDLSQYIVMDFVDGQTLASVALPRGEILEIFLRIAKAVESAHQAGVVHRDLKPANIMITKDKWPYVMDFGLAKALETDVSMSVTGTAMGTPAYMPPEQAEGRLDDIDARSDVYSLGATLYTVLLGRPPFGGSSAMQVIRKVSDEPVPTPRSIQPDFPLRLQAVLVKAMAKDRKDRHPTAAAFAEDLASCLADERTTPTPIPKQEPTSPLPVPPTRRGAGRGIAAILAVGLLLTAGAVAFWKYSGTTPQPSGEPKTTEQPAVPPAPPTGARTFSLRVAVHPFARVARLLRGRDEVVLAERDTPLLVPGLEIGDYELVLTHPQWGEKTVRISEGRLKAGKTVVVWGRMSDPSLKIDGSP